MDCGLKSLGEQFYKQLFRDFTNELVLVAIICEMFIPIGVEVYKMSDSCIVCCSRLESCTDLVISGMFHIVLLLAV